MDGLSRMAGAGPTITLGGKTLRVNGRVLESYAEIEAQIIKERDDPLTLAGRSVAAQNAEVAREYARLKHAGANGEAEEFRKTATALNKDFQKQMLGQAFTEARAWRNISGEEIQEWMETFRGQCFTAWLCLRDNDPQEYTLEKITTLILQDAANSNEKQVMATIQTAINQAGGEDEAGNSTGRSPEAEGAASSQSSGD